MKRCVSEKCFMGGRFIGSRVQKFKGFRSWRKCSAACGSLVPTLEAGLRPVLLLDVEISLSWRKCSAACGSLVPTLEAGLRPVLFLDVDVSLSWRKCSAACGSLVSTLAAGLRPCTAKHKTDKLPIIQPSRNELGIDTYS